MNIKKKVSTTKPANGFSKPMKVSAELAEIVGEGPMSRPQVTKKLWEYIKSNNLQIPENKRMIKPDAALAEVFGTKKATDMFKMTKLVGAHLS